MKKVYFGYCLHIGYTKVIAGVRFVSAIINWDNEALVPDVGKYACKF